MSTLQTTVTVYSSPPCMFVACFCQSNELHETNTTSLSNLLEIIMITTDFLRIKIAAGGLVENIKTGADDQSYCHK